MALTQISVTANFDNYMELWLSGNTSPISWVPFIYTTGSNGAGFETAEYIASATYAFSQMPVIWNSGGYSSNPDIQYISMTALQDSSVIYISACDAAGVVLTGYPLDPYYIGVKPIPVATSQLTAALSAFFLKRSNDVMVNIPSGAFRWTIDPANEGIYGGLSANFNEYAVNTTNPISGTSVSASKITYSYPPSGAYDQIASITFNLSDRYRTGGLVTDFTIPAYSLTFNPSITISNGDADTNTSILCAVQDGQNLNNSFWLNWNADDTTGLHALTGANLDKIYPFNSVSYASAIETIKLSATDLSKSYTYSLSSFTGITSGQFRPYGLTTGSTIITARNVQLPNEENVYVYTSHALGVTTGIAHNLSPIQYITWENDASNVQANRSDDTTSYTFDTIGTAANIDSLYLRITPPTVTTAPKICTTSFRICALSGSNLNEGILDIYDFNIQYTEWLSTDYFNPKFRFQYEPETQATIYRPVSSGTTILYKVSNTSKLPDNSIGSITFTFNTGVCSIPYDITNGQSAPSGVTYPFNTDMPSVCSITMSVCASATGYSDYFVRDAPSKQIVFANIPVASGFVVYPEFAWNGSGWDQVVDSYSLDRGNILLSNSILSAYGLCHTENFFLSSNVHGVSSSTWSIQNTDGTGTSYATTVNEATAWVPVKTPQNSAYLSVCAAVFTEGLSSDMPSRYYDVPSGSRFANFSTTFNPITSDHRQHIKIVGANNTAITPDMLAGINVQHPAPNNLNLAGKYDSLASGSLFTAYVPAFYFGLSSEFWNETVRASTVVSNSAYKRAFINVDDIGDSFLGVPLNEKTKIRITPSLEYTLQLKTQHPSANDWCIDSNYVAGSSNSIEVTAYPMVPVIYTPNRYILSGSSVSFDNLVQCFSAVSGFNWTDRNQVAVLTSCTPYTTAFDDEGNYSIQLNNQYYLGSSINSVSNTFTDIVRVQGKYLQFNPEIVRIFQVTDLALPYDAQDCSMPPNEWVVKDTFNATIKKLNDNLTYLGNMAHLYDVPPTDYVGWYGTLYYNNSARRTRWFTSTPHDSYAYDHPEFSLDQPFDNLQTCCVKNNIMYVSNGTTVSILSGDIFGTRVGYRTYKTIGDNFVNIRSVKLDSSNRIYLLDSYDSNNREAGSKNRVLVFSFNFDTNEWRLLYEWGGLGGKGARNKFNNPGDMHVDQNDALWVADTGNLCIKKYTRTGSWLATITSEYFTDTELPVSVTTDVDDNLYVLTTNQIVKFDSAGALINAYPIESGAIKIENCQDGGFIYATYPSKIVKYTQDITVAGNIGSNEFVSYTEDYRDVYHDEFRNLYVVNSNHILKYIDLLSLISLKLNTEDLIWPLEKLLVQKDEYIQDWVINRCFQRLWDNLEIFRQSLIGKFAYQTFRNVTSMTLVSSTPPPADFDYCTYDWLYNYSRLVTEDVVFEYLKPVVRTFTPDEYKAFPYSKEMVYIGINELNAADVYNRVINKLHECEELLLQMIND